jgi:hypothetical protein
MGFPWESHGITRKSSFQGSLYLSRESLGNQFFSRHSRIYA